MSYIGARSAAKTTLLHISISGLRSQHLFYEQMENLSTISPQRRNKNQEKHL